MQRSQEFNLEVLPLVHDRLADSCCKPALSGVVRVLAELLVRCKTASGRKT